MTTEGSKKILAIVGEPADADALERILAEAKGAYQVQRAESSLQALDVIYSDPPDLIVVDELLHEEDWTAFCHRIKGDTVFGHLPIVLVLHGHGLDPALDWQQLPVDDYLHKPLMSSEVLSRISLIFVRATRVRDANPLTRLPGNYSITREIDGCIEADKPFCIAYADLDNFKSYNDKYGFLRGDEIIKITARIVTNSVRRLRLSHGFVGHVGGDDFVFIVPPEKIDAICKEIIAHFDLVVGDFYDEDDRRRGFIKSKNRKGEEEYFPFVSLSIAVVTNEYRPIRHIGQVSAIAAEVKKHVKSMSGSNYYKDKRGSKAAVKGE